MTIFIRQHPWIFGAIGNILPPSIAVLLQYLLTKDISEWIPVVSWFGGALITLAVLWFVSKRSRDEVVAALTPTTVAQSPTVVQSPTIILSPTAGVSQAEGRVFSRRTPAELVGLGKGLTEIAAGDVVKSHIGNWLKVEGLVNDVSSSMGGKDIMVVLERSDLHILLLLHFDASKWKPQVSTLIIGDKISVIGTIRSIDRTGYVSLEECELLN